MREREREGGEGWKGGGKQWRRGWLTLTGLALPTAGRVCVWWSERRTQLSAAAIAANRTSPTAALLFTHLALVSAVTDSAGTWEWGHGCGTDWEWGHGCGTAWECGHGCGTARKCGHGWDNLGVGSRVGQSRSGVTSGTAWEWGHGWDRRQA